MSTKGCVGFFLFCLDLDLLIKVYKTSVQKPGLFKFLQITQDINEIKNPTNRFVDIGK